MIFLLSAVSSYCYVLCASPSVCSYRMCSVAGQRSCMHRTTITLILCSFSPRYRRWQGGQEWCKGAWRHSCAVDTCDCQPKSQRRKHDEAMPMANSTLQKLPCITSIWLYSTAPYRIHDIYQLWTSHDNCCHRRCITIGHSFVEQGASMLCIDIRNQNAFHMNTRLHVIHSEIAFRKAYVGMKRRRIGRWLWTLPYLCP